MRLTVGPLPPAVYWRRRAVVLGAGLLFLLVLLYSCTGSGGSGDNRGAGGSASTSPTSPAAVAPAATGSAPTGSPQASASGGMATGGGVAPAPPATSTVAPSVVAAPPPEGGCTDAEMSVIPEPVPATAQRGTVVALKLKIKNVSNRTCNRDVGADLQEIYIKIGAQKIWSSDTCGTARGSDVEPFTPGFERAYQVDWNGRDATRCADGVANGPFPAAGDYQVFGRLGTKLSDPVKLSLVG